MNQALVYIIILNYQSRQDTLGCLDSITQSDYENYHILVIDNNSPDGSGNKLRQDVKNFPNTEFIQNQKNLGYAEGNNIGIRKALSEGADYVLILNPDIRLASASISACVRTAEQDHAIGAINTIQLQADGQSIDEKFILGVFPPHLKNKHIDDIDFPEIQETQELFGAALFLTREAITKVGGFDPLYFAYGEEIDLCKRLRYHGFRLVIIKEAPVVHLRTKESNGSPGPFILFLRQRALYLGMLKDPWRAIRISMRRVAKRFWDDMLGKNKNKYPFKQYPVTRLICLKAFLWIVINIQKIRESRKQERLGAAHL